MIEKNKKSNFKYIAIVGVSLLGVIAIPFFVSASDGIVEIEQAVIEPLPSVEVVEVEQSVVDTEQVYVDPIKNVVEIAPAAGSEKPELESVSADMSVDENTDKINYDTVLSFPITEEKVKAFVIAADKIDQVNRKWDMQISSAETDTMAVEYITLSSEEMTNVMGSISEITVGQYNEIFEYTTKNPDFKSIVNAFKQYYVVEPRENRNQDPSSEISAN